MPVEKWSDSVVLAHLGDDPQFTEDLDNVIAAVPDSRVFVLDLGEVAVVNSSNLSALLRLRRKIVVKDGRLILCNVRGQVWDTIQLTGLEKVFEFSPNVATALATVSLSEKA